MSKAARLIPYIALAQRSTPQPLIYPATSLLGALLAGLLEKRRRVIRKNLLLLGVEATDALISRTIENWTHSLSDQIRSLWISKRELIGMVDDRGSRNLKRALDTGKGVVLVTAHLGNYELAGSYLAAAGFPIHAVVEEIPRGHMDVFNRIRTRFGMGVVGYSDIPRMLEILRQRKILVLLADRDIEDRGIKVSFGRGIRRVPFGPALLALRTGASIQTGYFVSRRAKYLCVINPVLDLKPPGSLKRKVAFVTKAISHELVSAIRSRPDQWFAFQDEWEPAGSRPPEK